MDISKLYIRIKLNGDIIGIIDEYDYTVNTSPKSQLEYKSLYITNKYFLTKKILLESRYSKDPRIIFLNRIALYNVLARLPNKIIEDSKKMYKTNEGKKEILKNNIELLISVLFPKNSFFFVKGVKFIIKNKTLPPHEIHDNNINKSKLLTYDELEDELEENLVTKEKKRLRQRLIQYEKHLAKLSDANKILFKKKHQILDYDESELNDKAHAKVISLLMSNTGTDLINNYGVKKVQEMNDVLIKKGKRSLYKYVNNKGIQFIEDKSKGIHCTVSLDLVDFKTPIHSELRHSCKTRKRKIKSLYNEILTGEEIPITSTGRIYKYTVDTLSSPLYSSDDKYALGSKSISRYKSLSKTKTKKNRKLYLDDNDDDNDDDDDIYDYDDVESTKIKMKRHLDKLRKYHNNLIKNDI